MLTEQEERRVRALLDDARGVGAASLLRRLFILKASGSQSIGTASGVEITVDTLEDLQHAHYVASVQSTDNTAIVDTIDGAGLIPAGTALSAIHYGILRRRQIGASAASRKIDVRLYISNTTGVTRVVSYEVWRIAGLGGPPA